MKVKINDKELEDNLPPKVETVEPQSQNKKMKYLFIAFDILVLLLIVGFLTWAIVRYWDQILSLSTKEGKDRFVEYVHNVGGKGVIILLIAQIFQVVVAFIPGEVIELAAGAIYGPWLGLLICEVGLILGTLCIFGLVKLLGKPFAQLRAGAPKKNSPKLKIFGDPVRALIILFSIFLIPGLPKDVLIYAVPFTKVRLRDFIIVSSIARIPSILTSTLVGAALVDQNYWLAGIVFGSMTVLAAFGLIYNKKIYVWIDKRIAKHKNKHRSNAEK